MYVSQGGVGKGRKLSEKYPISGKNQEKLAVCSSLKLNKTRQSINTDMR